MVLRGLGNRVPKEKVPSEHLRFCYRNVSTRPTTRSSTFVVVRSIVSLSHESFTSLTRHIAVNVALWGRPNLVSPCKLLPSPHLPGHSPPSHIQITSHTRCSTTCLPSRCDALRAFTERHHRADRLHRDKLERTPIDNRYLRLSPRAI